MNKRILLKLSGEALMGGSPFGIDVATISSIATELKHLPKRWKRKQLRLD